jgi:hypothetical protein
VIDATMAEKSVLPEWALLLYKKLKEERSTLEAQFEKQSLEIRQGVEKMKQMKQSLEISHDKDIQERTVIVNNEILNLRQQQKQLVDSYRTELGKKVEDLHQLTKKIEEKQKALEERKALLQSAEKEYEKLLAASSELKRKQQLDAMKQKEEEEARQRRALVFKLSQSENWLEEIVPTSPSSLTSFSTLAAVMTIQPEKYSTAMFQVLNLEGMPLLYAFAEALNEFLPNSDISEIVLDDVALCVMTVLDRLAMTEQVTMAMVEWDLARNGADRNRLLNEGGWPFRVLKAYARFFGSTYFQSSILPLVQQIIALKSNLELDPLLVKRGQDVLDHVRLIKSYAQQILIEIYDHVTKLPPAFRRLCRLLKEAAVKSTHPQPVHTMLLNFLFKAFFVPAIVTPEYYVPDAVPLVVSPENRRALTLVAKAVRGAAENVPFVEEWMGPLNILQAQNTVALRRFFDQVPLSEDELSASPLSFNSPISVAEALRLLPHKLVALPSKVKSAVVKFLDAHPLYAQKRYTCTSDLIYSPFLRLQIVLNDLGVAPSDPDALLLRTLTSTDRDVLALMDFVLGSSESNSSEMSLGVAIREVMHQLNDVTQRNDLVTVSSSWPSSNDMRFAASSGSPATSPRPGVTLTSVSSNVSPYKESSSKDNTPPLSRPDQLAKSVVLVAYFRDPTSTEHLLISALFKEWASYAALNIFVFIENLCYGFAASMFQFYAELVGKNYLLYLLKPLVEEVRKAKMAFTLDGKDYGVDFFKKNLKKYMATVESWLQTLPTALNSAPVTLWKVCHAMSALVPEPLAPLLCVRWLCVALDAPERYELVTASAGIERNKLLKRLPQVSNLLKHIALKVHYEKNSKGVNDFIAEQHANLTKILHNWAAGAQAPAASINTVPELHWAEVDKSIRLIHKFLSVNLPIFKQVLGVDVRLKPVYTLGRLVQAMLSVSPSPQGTP